MRFLKVIWFAMVDGLILYAMAEVGRTIDHYDLTRDVRESEQAQTTSVAQSAKSDTVLKCDGRLLRSVHTITMTSPPLLGRIGERHDT